MDGHEAGWIERGSTWRRVLDQVQPVIEELALTVGADVTRARWDAPDLNMVWYSANGTGRAIQIVIAGSAGNEELEIDGSIWKDTESPRQRNWMTKQLSRPPIGRDRESLDPALLQNVMRGAVTEVAAWDEDDLTNTDALPSRPEHVLEEGVQGHNVS